MKQKENKKITIKETKNISSISPSSSSSPPLSINFQKRNHETLHKFIESGGKKCYELFQYLSSSTHW